LRRNFSLNRMRSKCPSLSLPFARCSNPHLYAFNQRRKVAEMHLELYTIKDCTKLHEKSRNCSLTYECYLKGHNKRPDG
jgi:hypothetical protein